MTSPFRAVCAVAAPPAVIFSLFALCAVVGTIDRASGADDPASRAKAIIAEIEAHAGTTALSGGGAPAASASSPRTPMAPQTARGSGDGGVDGGSDAGARRGVDIGVPRRTPSSPLEVAASPIAEARRSLQRAEELRRLGDARRAEIAEDAAMEWALTARDLVAALDAEREADDLAVSALAATTQADRARALLEEAITRRGRLQARLDQIERELAERPDAAPKKPAPAPRKNGAPK